MLRVVFFGSAGAYSAVHLDALVREHHVVGTFCAAGSGPRGRAGRLLRSAGLRSDPLTAVVRAHRLERWFVDRQATGAGARIAALRPDVVCVAGYPWLLPSGIWAPARFGALNSHPSLLPRHRGILPLFWIYYRDDRETGVTVHRMTADADGGAILYQNVYPLSRGCPVDQLNTMNAENGGRALLTALASLASGSSCEKLQDSSIATAAPYVRPGSAMVDFAWDVERVWHFLAGLFPWFKEPLRDDDGRHVDYAHVGGYERVKPAGVPGSVEPVNGEWRLHCEGGVVWLAPSTRAIH